MRQHYSNSVNEPYMVTCPRCGSGSVSGGRKGYSLGKGCLGFIIMLPFALIFSLLGLLLGQFGANRVKRTCLNCKYRW